MKANSPAQMGRDNPLPIVGDLIKAVKVGVKVGLKADLDPAADCDHQGSHLVGGTREATA
jgi:hypothetical protein